MEVEDTGGKLGRLLCCPGVALMPRVDAQIAGRVIVGGLLGSPIETPRLGLDRCKHPLAIAWAAPQAVQMAVRCPGQSLVLRLAVDLELSLFLAKKL